MNKKTMNDIKLGLFLVGGLAVFIVIIYYIGSRQQMFGNKVQVTALFENVSGLLPGNNVRFSGITVGSVKEIRIATDSTARVEMLVNEEASRFIKKDAFATIESDGLMGNKIVAISTGSPESKTIEEGDRIRTREPVDMDDLITSFAETSDHTRNLTRNLAAISDQIKNAEGLLGKLVSDSVLAQRVTSTVAGLEQTSLNAARITRQIEKVTQELSEGNGLLARVIHDEELGNTIITIVDSVHHAGNNLTAASRELNTFMKSLNGNNGMLNKMLKDSTTAENFAETMENVKRGTEDLDEVMSTVNNSWLLNLFSGNKD